MSFSAWRRLHFVGIGGAGMSGIAKILLERGHVVTGCDLKASGPSTALEGLGARIQLGHDADHLDGADCVIYSSAVPATNPELRRARALGLPLLRRGEALATLLQGRPSIVVAGTHGKTTTTSMIVSVLVTAGMDPTFVVGGVLRDLGTNARDGGGEFVVAESDESDGSFLLLQPDIAVVTNIEADHLDHWGSIDAIRTAFSEFLASPGRWAVVARSDGIALGLAQRSGRDLLTYGFGGDVDAVEVRDSFLQTRFLLTAGGRRVLASLGAPGSHNLSNALAAAAACVAAGLTLDEVVDGLASFAGVERRFDLRGEAAGVTVIDDYAHHPSEIEANLATARAGPWRRVVAVFQPHLYSRTAALASEFGTAFAAADVVVVTDVFGAREQPVTGVTGKLVSDAACSALPGRPVAYLPRRADVVPYLASRLHAGDVVLTLGAGDITTLADPLLACLRTNEEKGPAGSAGVGDLTERAT